MAAADTSTPQQDSPWGKLIPFRKDHAHLTMCGVEYSIGRSKRCSIRLHNPEVSGMHCTIHRLTSGVWITDSSTNGTYVNGRSLVSGTPRALHNGDQISLVQPTAAVASRGCQVPCVYSFYHFHNRPSRSSQMPLPTDKQAITSLFELLTVLGEGSFGEVHLARQRSTGEEVAIKMIRKRSLQLNAHSMTDVLQEAQMMAKLRHPYLARLQSCWNDKDYIYLVMDLYRGGELFERVIDKARGPYDEADASIITLRLLLAIQHLHEHNIAHRDLKPENIMIVDSSDETDVRIVDFGGAKQLSSSGMRTYVGSIQYMAPEVMERKGSVLGQGRYTQACDMWSLGMIVYVTLSAYTPFNADIVKTAKGPITWSFAPEDRWAVISSDCKSFIRSLLQLDPAERMAVDEALMHPWIGVKYKEWSVSNPEHASDHAKLQFGIGGPVSSSAATCAVAVSLPGAGAGAGAGARPAVASASSASVSVSSSRVLSASVGVEAASASVSPRAALVQKRTRSTSTGSEIAAIEAEADDAACEPENSVNDGCSGNGTGTGTAD